MEVGIDDLAMDSHEAGPLLLEAGVELAGADLDELVRRTEGWPVGLYLAALAVNAGGSPTAAGAALTGDDRYIGDYLRSEILDRVSPAEASFLTHTSILDRMCGPLCDAVLGVTGSAALLERLERRNLLVVPLDRRREWYRYHQLFRELLVSELRRSDPEVVPELHLRAAAWCEANGMPESAIDHAQAAGDADTVARLVVQICNPVWASGRNDTVRRWMEWFEANDLIERYPGIAVCGALQFAVDGRPAATERWADAAEATIDDRSAHRREHDRGHGGLPAGEPVPQRAGGDATRRPGRLAWTQPGQSVSLQHDPGRGPLPSARGRRRPRRCVLRPRRRRSDPLRACDRSPPSCSPTAAARRLERDDWAAAGTFADQALTIMHGGRVRRLLDERPRVCLGGPGRRPTR